MSEFNKRLNQIKKKLLDLSKRNKLINYHRPSKSRNLKIIDESPEFIYNYLLVEDKTFQFKAIPYPHMMPEYRRFLSRKRDFEKNIFPSLELEKRVLFYNFSWRSKDFSPLSSLFVPDSLLEKRTSLLEKEVEVKTEYQTILVKLDELEKTKDFTVESQAKALGLVISNEMPKIELEDEDNFDIHVDKYLQTLHYADELEKILKHIDYNSQSIMEITGSNMLYLILGVLEWSESNKPEVKIKSPLITLPVALKREQLNKESYTYGYTLSYTGDVIDSNESLSQKLFNDFGIKLPRLSEEISFSNYLKEVQKLCVGKKEWKIKQEISLDFLQFGKVLMYKDLHNHDASGRKLDAHPILRDIFLGVSEENSCYALNEYNIDNEAIAHKIPLVLDADSSQHSAMVDVLKGKNVVIEGPPGSGKSQIIANLIAVLMNEGKKVLFVSEKLVALEVVYQRLEQIGLGDFCLELHSHKTDKVEFLQNLDKRIRGRYSFAYEYESDKSQLSLIKKSLNDYLDILHTVYGANNKTIFENIWLREYYWEGAEYFLFKINNALSLKNNDLLFCEDHLKEYARHYPDYDVSTLFWKGLKVSDLSFMKIDAFISLILRLKAPYGLLAKELEKFKVHSKNEPLVLENLKNFLEAFDENETYYFPYSQIATFRNLEDKLQAYLKIFMGYVERSEIDNLSTADILQMAQNSSTILTQLSEFESELKPELLTFQKFIEQAEKNFDTFEEIAKRNSKNIYLPIVNHNESTDIYKTVRTVMNNKDSWFRFLSPFYKGAKNKFASMLKVQLPDNSDEWTFLLRELNLYTLNRENQLNLRVSLVEKVPLFIKKIEGVERNIKKSLNLYASIEQSSIADTFKNLLYANVKNSQKFDLLMKQQHEVENILAHIEPYGTLTKTFYPSEELTFKEMAKKIDEVEENKTTLPQWITFQLLVNKLNALGLKEMMKSAAKKEIPADKLVKTFYYNYHNSLVKQAFLEHPILESFSHVKQDSLVKKFKKLDVKLIEKNRVAIAHKLSKKVLPASEGQGRVGTFTNLKLLKHEINKKRRHVPIRQLLKRSGAAIEVLKPCFMMSPLSVAQYLPIEKTSFDVLLIDEASQLKPEEALGVIARAKQVVVVGDPKQLPPTSFFDVAQEEVAFEKKTVLDDSESILDSFMELYSPIRRLKWHYRSGHESLIDFSNRHFYDNELTIFPSPNGKVDESLGVKYTYVEDGVYKSGDQHRTNIIEAQKVLETIKYQMEFFPEKSMGVGTLNGTQKELIQELVDTAEKECAYVSSYIERWKDNHEAFFVKNLESLQGDERDVILISTTYGKEEGSTKLNQRFGPINQENGWRRLNVLITRSKQKMHVFTSMLSSDIRASNNSSRGVKSLKNFLKFLEQGYKEQQNTLDMNSSHNFTSVFAEVLYKVLKEKGIQVVPNVGVSGYYIDLAIVSKKDGRYILAIECDGHNYYAAKSSSDRYRLKTEALKRLGWKHYHIWSAQWYKSRELELHRLLNIIEESERNDDSKEHKAEVRQEVFSKEPNALDDASIIDLLSSSETEKVLNGIESITSEISDSLLPIILGVFKVYPDVKVRKKALESMKKYENSRSIALLEICEKKRYRSMRNESQMKKDFQKMANIEGFDLDAFANYMAWRHPHFLGNHHFIMLETDEVEKFILERLNIEKVVLIESVSSKFLKATNIQDLSVARASESLWKMSQLKRLKFNAMGMKMVVAKDIAKLKELQELYVYARDIRLSGSSDSLELLSIQACETLAFDENAVFKNVKKINFVSTHESFSMDILALKRSIPNLEVLEAGSLVYRDDFLKKYKVDILTVFPDLEFINFDTSRKEYLIVGSDTYVRG